MSDRPEPTGSVEYVDPEGLPKNPAFTQAVVVTGPVKTVYVGMQNAVDATGAIVGMGDIGAQTEQTLKNVQICLEACGARPEHLIQWNIYVAQGRPIQPAVEAFQRWWGSRPHAPLNSVLLVPDFVRPGLLVGIDAIAVVPLAL